MRKFLILAYCLFTLTAMAQDSSGFPFYEGPFDEMKIDAMVQAKPFLVFFYTDWCASCKDMRDKVMANKELQAYVKENLLAFKVDAESLEPDGVELAQRYGVLFFPTVIVFNYEGKEIKRVSGFQNSTQLEAALEKYRFINAPPSSITSSSYAYESSSPSGTSSARNLDLEEEPTTIYSPPPLPTRQINSSSQVIPSESGLYRVTVRHQLSSGYGVQIGVYAEYPNVLKAALELERDFPGDVLVHLNASGGNTVFKLLVGPYDSEVTARNVVEKLQQRLDRSGFVVDLSTFL